MISLLIIILIASVIIFFTLFPFGESEKYLKFLETPISIIFYSLVIFTVFSFLNIFVSLQKGNK